MSSDRWSAIERIFHAALERPVDERAAFLAESCAGDDTLRREVEALLDQSSNTGFLEEPALRVAARMAQEANGAANLTGQRLGVYLVQGLLGKGGMGEVYRARDTRLDRDVAIKVLPRAFTADPDRLARFEREARVLASLNHSHIGMIHGLEESRGTLALVLELIKGDTLADRIARGPVPVKQALIWARQIADALDAAHEKGIVHRDLKPANIKITPDDVVKVLDFGLARTYDEAEDATRSPTITSAGGAVLGTAAYMSPEQARGQPVGKRADIWAFGCVLFEMLTGRVAFDGQTVSDTIAAVLHHDPDWTALPVNVPPAIATLLQRCLEKDVRQRRRDIADVRAELDDAIAQPASGARRSDAIPTAPPSQRPVLWWTLAAVAGIAVAAAAGFWAGRRPTTDPPTNKSAAAVTPPQPALHQITDTEGMEEWPAVSPDGKTVAYVASVNGRRQIWIRSLASGGPLQRTHDDVDHLFPRWLPNSSALICFTPPAREGESGKLWEIPELAGPAHPLVDATTGGDVSHDGRRLAVFKRAEDKFVLVVVERNGPIIRELALPPALDYTVPRWSPDDRSIAFIANDGNVIERIYVLPADGAPVAPRPVTQASSINGFTWLPDNSGFVYASSAGSTLLYPPVMKLRVVSLDSSADRPLLLADGSYVQPDIGQAGKLFASRVRMQSDIWGFPVRSKPADFSTGGIRITQQTAQVQTPSANPLGKEIAYLSDSGGHANVWVTNIDGSGTPRQITTVTEPDVNVGLPIWSPAGNRLVYIKVRGSSRTQWVVNPDGFGNRQVVDGGTSAVWSSDGKWLYYQRYSATESCIYKRPVDDENAGETTVRCDAAVPMVSRDEAALFFSPHRPEHAFEVFKASPPNGKESLVARYSPTQIPLYPQGHALSYDDRWIAVPLKDGVTTNIWAISTAREPMRKLTDFKHRAILIGRQVSWSKDGKFVYAAVVQTDADIVLLDGISLTGR